MTARLELEIFDTLAIVGSNYWGMRASDDLPVLELLGHVLQQSTLPINVKRYLWFIYKDDLLGTHVGGSVDEGHYLAFA